MDISDFIGLGVNPKNAVHNPISTEITMDICSNKEDRRFRLSDQRESSSLNTDRNTRYQKPAYAATMLP